LRLRREVADARGALHSLHALGRVRAALGDPAGAADLLDEADQLAADLDEPLERAKVTHTRAEWALRAGEAGTALDLAGQALAAFQRCATGYDVAHAQLTLAVACAASGQERQAITPGAAGRAAVDRQNYGLLRHLYPATAFLVADRIAAALTAYTCGDALGLPWEGQPPSATTEQIEALPAPAGAERGATSDDTALTLLVCQHLASQPPDGPIALLRIIAEKASTIHGLGPSTLAAIESFRTTDQPPTSGGNTNGAAMRALPVGWATPLEAYEEQRQLAIELAHLTHPGAEATCAACVMAACASWAVEGASAKLLLDVAIEEATEAARILDADTSLADILASVAKGTWTAPKTGVSIDPYETVCAVLACLVGATSVREALLSAVRLGGDTDTVAALVGGLAAARSSTAQLRAELLWAEAISLPSEDATAELAAALASKRAASDHLPQDVGKSASL
jgi:ADP-ribosylglycohydrolase